MLNIALPNVPQSVQSQDLFFTFTAGGLPEAGLVVTEFSVEEGLSRLYRADIGLVSRNPAISLADLIDKPALLTVHDRYSQPRHFHGVVASAERGDRGDRFTRYHVTLRPELHRLRYGSDMRIFQQKSVVEIIETILRENGVTHFRFGLADRHEPREYCTQFRERHLDFIERLMSEEGISYHFEHEDGRHVLVITDETIAAANCPVTPALEYNATPGGDTHGQFVRRFRWREEVETSEVHQRDHWFRHPVHRYDTRHKARATNGLTRGLEHYDYPGRYKKDAVGAGFTRYRLEAFRDEASHGEGLGRCQHLLPGHRFAMEAHYDAAMNRRFLLVAVSQRGEQPAALEEDQGLAAPANAAGAGGDRRETGGRNGLGGGAADGGTYLATRFRCIPHDVPWRPEHRPKPLTDGPQMAIVSGPEGEEIFCDDFGRVKVFFPWDRHGTQDDKSSCWVRAAQNWSGAGWGHIAIPRIGQHVIVDYIDGDPDQPFITGRSYNADNPPPYKLPDHKTRMVIRSDTHKGGGYNEISFEDENGRQNIFTHAQKDQTIKVLNNRAKRVEANQVESIGANKSIDVGGNHQEKIGGAMNISVGGGGGPLLAALGAIAAAGGKDSEIGSSAVGDPLLAQFASGMAALGVGAEASSLPANGAFAGAGNHRLEAGKDQMSTASSVGGLLSSIMPLSGILTSVVEKFQTDTIGIARTEQIGAYKNTSVGHTMTINVGTEFIIKVGKSRFIMDKDGNVTITGVKFNFAASGHVQINGKIIDLN